MFFTDKRKKHKWKFYQKCCFPLKEENLLSNEKPQKKTEWNIKGNAMEWWKNGLEISEHKWEVAFFLNSYYTVLTLLQWPAGIHWNHLTDADQWN
jgi:hypothetical protein